MSTGKYPLSRDELLLLEIDYSSYDGSCKDPHLMTPYGLVECRRERGHDGDVHATRAGIYAITWPVEHTTKPEGHGADWSDWQAGDDGPSCECGYNGTPEDCLASRTATPEGASE